MTASETLVYSREKLYVAAIRKYHGHVITPIRMSSAMLLGAFYGVETGERGRESFVRCEYLFGLIAPTKHDT